MQDVGGVAARAGRLRGRRGCGRRGCRRRQLPRRPPEKGGIVGDPERQPDIRASDTVTGLTPAPPCPRAARVRAARVQDTRVRVLTCDAHTLCTSRTPRGPRPDAPAPPSAPKVELPTGGGGSLRCCVGDTGALPGRVSSPELSLRVSRVRVTRPSTRRQLGGGRRGKSLRVLNEEGGGRRGGHTDFSDVLGPASAQN